MPQITWTRGTNATTESTFDRVFGAAAGALPGLYADGVHLRVITRSEVPSVAAIESDVRRAWR